MSLLRIIFFGTPDAARYVLEELFRAGIVPNMIIASPDEPKGRGLEIAPPPVKVYAEQKGIPVFQPKRLDDESIATIAEEKPDIFIIAAYGKILPQALLAVPRRGAINIHPSLLPKYRGASPVRDAILSGEGETGVSIMQIDEKMDHGPIIAQKKVDIHDVPKARTLEERLMRTGGRMIVNILPDFLKGNIKPIPQDHAKATFTRKWKKEDGLVDILGDPIAALRRIRACDGWPGAYFFAGRNDPKAPMGALTSKKIRVNIADAHITDGKLVLDLVIPEGKREMPYADFLRGFVNA